MRRESFSARQHESKLEHLNFSNHKVNYGSGQHLRLILEDNSHPVDLSRFPATFCENDHY